MIGALKESGVVWGRCNIKLSAICLKVQNCSKLLGNGHIRVNTKIQFPYTTAQMLHIKHTTLSTFFLEKYVIKLPELISGPVTIWLVDAIIHNVLERVPFFLKIVILQCFSKSTLRLDYSWASDWYKCRFFLKVDKHSPWETSCSPLKILYTVLKLFKIKSLKHLALGNY